MAKGELLTLPTISERHLAAVWSTQGGAILRGPYWTVGNQAVAVIYRGRWDGGPGPDFRDAVLELEGRELLRGDVELHLHAADWQRHGHHADPAYNNVVLHVTLHPPRPNDAPIVREDGRAIPTLALQPYLTVSLRELPAAAEPLLPSIPTLSEEPCWQAARDLPALTWGHILDGTGNTRFTAKAAAFEAALFSYDSTLNPSQQPDDHAAQVLYAAMLDALGYSQNRAPMQQLATALPLHILEEMVGSHLPQAALLEAALVGTAGLLPSQRKPKGLDYEAAEYSAELERLWEMVKPVLRQHYTSRKPPATIEWQFAKVRPANYPPRRLAAAAALLTSYLRPGLLPAMREIAAHTTAPDLPDALTAAMQVAAPESFWANHADFGSGLGGAQDLIGESRAADIALNVLLPFLHSDAYLRDDRPVANKTHLAYNLFPKLAENETTRRMAAELLGPRKSERGLLATARRQQGLIHLYREHCGEQRCTDCPVAAAIREVGKLGRDFRQRWLLGGRLREVVEGDAGDQPHAGVGQGFDVEQGALIE